MLAAVWTLIGVVIAGGVATLSILLTRIDRVDKKIEDLDTRLSGKIEDLDTRLSGKIEGVDTDLGAKVDVVDTDLGAKVDVVDTDLSRGLAETNERLARIEGSMEVLVHMAHTHNAA
jgi:hypothetical protein